MDFLLKPKNQNLLIIWVDANIENEENSATLIYLKKELKESISCFKSTAAAFKFVVKNNQSFFLSIISGKLVREFLELSESQENIIKIIVYCLWKEKYADLPSKNSRIRAIVIDKVELKREIQNQRVSFERTIGYENLTLKAGYHFLDNQSFIEYILINFLFKLIRKLEKTENALIDLIEFSTNYIKTHKNTDEEEQFKILEELRKDFIMDRIDEKIVEWYSKECFFYRMLNNTLRDNNIISIFKIRLAIFYLDKNLHIMGEDIKNYPQKLYKGSEIEKHEFEFWKGNHTPIFFKDFVSTSEDEKIAKGFIKRFHPDCFPVLFRIDVDEAFKHQVIGIQSLSACKWEKEFLISINSFLIVKEITKVEKSDGKLDYFLIVAKFSDFKKMEVSEITQTYMNNIEQIFLKNYNNEIFFLAEYFKQNSLFQEIVDLLKDVEPKNSEDEVLLYSYLGYSYLYSDQFNKAEENFQKEKALLQKQHRIQDMEYGICESNIGELYFYRGNLKESSIHFENALKIGTLYKNKELKFVAECLQKIGEVHYSLSQFEQAKAYFFSSNKIFSDKLQNFPAYADNLGKLGHLFCTIGELDQGFQYFNESLRIAEKTIGKINLIYLDIISRYSISLYKNKQPQTAIDLLAKYIKKIESENQCKQANALKEVLVRFSEAILKKNFDNPNILNELENYKRMFAELKISKK